MKTVKFAFLFVSALLFFSQIVSAQYNSKVYADGELLVKFKDGTASAAARSANSRFGARVVEEFPDLGWQRVKLPAGVPVETAAARYAGLSDVEYVQPNFIYNLQATPNDPRFSDAGMYGLTKISAPSAWDLTTGSPNVVVANIDTGINYNHEDLAANMWTNPGETNGNNIDDDGNGFVDDYYGYDFFFNDPNPQDENGHGTHTAGTIGAVGNNNIGIVGINWNVRIMAIKIYNSTGFGTTSAMLVNAYNYVRMMKNRGVNIRVTNNSYGGCDEACNYDQATKDALDALGNAGILNVFAAGNNGRNIETQPFYPASYTSPSVLSVANSTSTDTRSGSSNFGPVSVDLAAPGTGILSTHTNVNGYATFTGTSMASPHVAGAAALLAAYNPNLSAASLKATIMNTVDVLADWNGVVKTGGRLNVDRALRNQTACSFSLSAYDVRFDFTGGSGSVNVTAPANCDYSIKSNSAWLTVTSASVGSGNATVTFTVQGTNLPDLYRIGIISIGEQNLIVRQGSPFVSNRSILDFDGDRRTDYSAIQNSNGAMIWHNMQSSGGYSVTNFGLFAEDIPVTGDYDNDGRSDIAVWRNTNGYFYILRSGSNTFQAVQFGSSGDNPNVTQDFDGDGAVDYAVVRKENGKLVWYILGSFTGFRAVQFGNETDIPLRGDYEGDGRADLAVYRPATGSPANTFIVQRSTGGALLTSTFGNSTTDKILPNDYDGDLRTDFAVWRTTDGTWYWIRSIDGAFKAFQFGAPGDLPAPGDYDGDVITDFAVWRPNQNPNQSAIFYVQRSTAGFSAFGWGNSTMKIPANSMQSQ
ncbi:MAG TPA: S8 family serine peptidase [Pyrinomonadaceae bacterium]|nr:S8 family serine peptidase [Pyrinomonadaceae bacterium]